MSKEYKLKAMCRCGKPMSFTHHCELMGGALRVPKVNNLTTPSLVKQIEGLPTMNYKHKQLCKDKNCQVTIKYVRLDDVLNIIGGSND